jgi:hypothetical protein
VSSRYHECQQYMVTYAKRMLAEDRATNPDGDVQEMIRNIAEGLALDLQTSIAIQLRGILYEEKRAVSSLGRTQLWQS